MPAHLELIPAWREIRDQLRRAVGDSTYEIWLAPVEIKEWDGRRLVLQAPPATQAWVAKRFGRILESAAQAAIGSAVQVAFSGLGSSCTSARRTPSPGTHTTDPTPAVNPRYSFDQFVIGDTNRLAHAAALVVAELPGQAYNPLFLHAPPGLGKTHLLHAIANYVLAFGGGATVRYTTVEAFTNHFITALHSRTVDAFKEAYRTVDVLLIDDVQFLASKAKTEEEFFHTFNTLYETGRQLVLTCDRLPRALVTVEERLRERFESGLVATITPPDFATRVTILRKRATLDNVRLHDDTVLELIAERVVDNVRALEGALIRIVASHSLTGRPLDLRLARAVLDEMHPAHTVDRPTIPIIQKAVAGYFGLSVDELLSSSRAARVAWPRQVAIHFSRELTDASLERIGEAFGGRNHATVLHAAKRVSSRLTDDPEAAADIDELRSRLTQSSADRTY